MIPVTSPLSRAANYPPQASLDIFSIQTTIQWKTSVRVATAAALPAYTRVGDVLTANSVANINTAGIDSVTTIVKGDRILVKDGAAGADNGVYDFTAIGATGTAAWVLTRSADACTAAPNSVTSGLSVFVEEGTANSGKSFALTTANPITLNTTSLTFTAQSAASPTAVNGTTFPATPAIGQVPIAQTTTSVAWSAQPGCFHTVRNLVLTNVASLAAYTVTSGALNDNVSGGNVAGDRVLLIGQSTPSQNGIYVVGTVTATTAPLTRATDWLLTAVLPSGATVAVNAGAIWANTIWFASVAGDVTVGTTVPAFCPERYSLITAAMSGTPGTFAVTGAYILSATLSSVQITVKVPGTQGFLSVGTLTASLGSGSFTVTSTANETSTLYISIRNR